jgi:broad specificity phosphatase PhoE
MPEITLVRHGQAKQNATSEEDYDRLSDLGRTQAKWAGEHLRKLKLSYDAIVTGTLTRQIDTQILMNIDAKAPVVRDDRFNEIRLYDLAGLLKKQFGIDLPKDELSFKQHLNLTFKKWENGEILNPPETFQNYKSRVSEGLNEIKDLGEKILLVTSGGIVAMAIKHTLNLNTEALGNCLLASYNTGITKLLYYDQAFVISQVNALPHLETPERWTKRTYT